MTKAGWNDRVGKITGAVYREAKILMWLGFLVYGGGSAAILYFMGGQPALATLAIMYLFQVLVLFFGTRKMYPCIAGGYRAAIEANRDTVPLFEKIASVVDGVDKDPDGNPLVRSVTEGVERVMRKFVDEEFRPAVESWRRLGERLEREVDQGFLDEARDALRSVRDFAEPKAPPAGGADRALAALSRPRGNGTRPKEETTA